MKRQEVAIEDLLENLEPFVPETPALAPYSLTSLPSMLEL